MEKIVLKVADGTEMHCHVTRPKNANAQKPAPGLIMFQEAFGLNTHMDVVAQQYADEGFLVIAPELFHRTCPPGFTARYDQFPQIIEHYKAVTDKTVAEDAAACLTWLKQNGVKQAASIGYCMGGKASFLANAAIELDASISYYGGGISDCLSLVPNLKADMLFFWGGLDSNIPAEQIAKINQAMDNSRKRYTCVQVSDAHHAFSNEERPSYNPNASKLAFKTSLEFLHQRLDF